jgi:hypothetical protein
MLQLGIMFTEVVHILHDLSAHPFGFTGFISLGFHRRFNYRQKRRLGTSALEANVETLSRFHQGGVHVSSEELFRGKGISHMSIVFPSFPSFEVKRQAHGV